MGFFNSIKRNIPQFPKKQEEGKTQIKKQIDKNISIIKDTFKDCNDIVYRDFTVGGPEGTRFFIFYIDGMTDKILLDNFVLSPMMINSRIVNPSFEGIKKNIFEVSKKSALTVSDFKDISFIEEALSVVLSGDTAMLIDGFDIGMSISTRLWPARGISEPSAETTIRGPRDGFTETIRFNTALVRRRIRDTKFKVKQSQIGTRSKTDVAIMYIEDIADNEIVKEVERRLKNINIDAILDSGYIQQFIEDRQFTPFPQVQATERPDVVAAAIYEGRIGILVDNSPFAIIVPVTLTALFQSSEDYYSRPVVASFVRIIRVIAGFLSLVSPALYIAITSFHPGIIPSKLALFIAATREGVPFPAFAEAIVMELTFELLREAGVRLPRPIGSTIGIVGGIVIGQAAVSAQIVSPIMVIVVAVTAISSFAIPNYEVAAAFRIIRFILMMAAAIYGLYGMVLGIIGVLIHMVNIKSFGVPYLSPVTSLKLGDLKDGLLFRTPWKYMKKRPEHLNPKNLVRQGGDSDGSK